MEADSVLPKNKAKQNKTQKTTGQTVKNWAQSQSVICLSNHLPAGIYWAPTMCQGMGKNQVYIDEWDNLSLLHGLPLAHCVLLGSLLNFSDPLFPHLSLWMYKRLRS